VYFADRAPVTLDLPALEELVASLSAVFREYPDIQNSSASVSAYSGNKYLVNTEGTRLRTACARLAVTVTATVQADDGMKLSDALSVHARKLDALPARDELLQRCRTMAERLIALRDAPLLAPYTGPVLVDAAAAAALFARQFGTAFAGGQRPVGSRASPDDFANKLNKRILPRFLNVVDDPTQKVIGDMPVMGHYRYDAQGVPAQAVQLVKAGRLTALLMSRNPSREFKQSNGHGRGAFGTVRAALACLIVTADPGDDAATLKAKLVSACEDEDLEFGVRVAALSGTGEAAYRPADPGGLDNLGPGRRGAGGLTPLVMYKVYPDSREELVRGAEIARLDFKAFKRIRAAGDTPFVLNFGGGAEGQTVVAPALLFEELDLAKIDRDFDKPPILPTPLARP
jgi:TldD protein